MGSPTSATTENPELPSRRPGGTGSKGTPAAATDDAFVDAASYSYERPSRSSWPSEVPPTGVLMTGVLGELAFYYGACWLHYRSAQRRVK
jgi:hypothetical protein